MGDIKLTMLHSFYYIFKYIKVTTHLFIFIDHCLSYWGPHLKHQYSDIIHNVYIWSETYRITYQHLNQIHYNIIILCLYNGYQKHM